MVLAPAAAGARSAGSAGRVPSPLGRNAVGASFTLHPHPKHSEQQQRSALAHGIMGVSPTGR